MTKYHHGRPDVDAQAPERAAHAETDAPDAMVDRLLGLVWETFYKGQDGRKWLQEQRPLIRVLTWPAVWLNERGVGMPVADYEAKLREIIATIARHGNRAEIRHVPAYLGDCIRAHFQHHGDEIYEARKHVRNALDMALLKGLPARPAMPDAVPSLVAAHAVLATARRPSKPARTDASQGTLF